MNLFVVGIVADKARAEAVERAILEAHRRTTPFATGQHDRTVWRRGHAIGASFSIHADRTAITGYTRDTEHAFDTFCGLPRLASLAAGRSWADALGQARDEGRFDPRELGGVWALARATPTEVEVTASSTGSEPILLARRPGLVLLSNRATLLRLAAWPEFPIAYDTDALMTLCARGWLAHDRVPFSGLELLPPGARARVTPDGVNIEVAQHLAPPVPPPDDPPTDAELAATYDHLATEMVDAAREVGHLGRRPRIELTGDAVTRLSAAVYAAADVEVTLTTPHAAEEPHGIVAAEVAAAIAAQHVCEPVELAHDDLPGQLTTQVFHGEGTSNVFDPCPLLRLDPVVEVVRHAGGALLGGYDNLATGPRPPVTDIEAGRTFLDALALHNATLLLRDEARTAQQQINRRTAEELLDEVGRLSFHELAYLRLREGRGTGANRQAAAYGSLQVAPTLDDRVLRHLGDIPLDHKRSQRAVFELVQRLAPALTRVRFVGGRWRFEADGPDPLLDPDTWAQREPLVDVAATDRVSAAWRTRPDGSLLPRLVRSLGEPDALLDEIIDRRRLTTALSEYDRPVPERDLRSLFGALTAKHLLSGDWRPTGRSRRA